jgi:hypothetical protein
MGRNLPVPLISEERLHALRHSVQQTKIPGQRVAGYSLGNLRSRWRHSGAAGRRFLLSLKRVHHA